MKRYFYFLLVAILGLCPVLNVCAQEDYSSKNLHFVYIDHEVTTPVTELCDKLQSLHDDASEVDDALIIYLSDGRSSQVSFTNLKDQEGRNRDSESAFTEIIAALEDANSHDVVASMDVNNILNLFSEYNFININGKFIFNSITFDFYVGNNFWSLGNNEKVIAHLYECFSMFSLPRGLFTMNIYKSKLDHIQYPDGMPFGDNNIEGINENVKILEY